MMLILVLIIIILIIYVVVYSGEDTGVLLFLLIHPV